MVVTIKHAKPGWNFFIEVHGEKISGFSETLTGAFEKIDKIRILKYTVVIERNGIELKGQ